MHVSRGVHGKSLYFLSCFCEPKTCPKTKNQKTLKSQVFFFFFFFFIFIYFWLFWVCCWVQAFSSCVSRDHSLLQCAAFSLWWSLLQWSTGLRLMGFSSCGSWAQLSRDMRDFTAPWIELVSLASQDGFLTTGLPGKPTSFFFSSVQEHTHLPSIIGTLRYQ